MIYGIILIGILSRFIPHIPNFTPVLAVALFAGRSLPKRHAMVLSVGILAVSDLFLGFHPTMPFTWGSIALIAGMGCQGRFKGPLKSVFAYWLITNLGVWLVSGLYPQTLTGLLNCYAMAIPFLKMTFISTLLYVWLFDSALSLGLNFQRYLAPNHP